MYTNITETRKLEQKRRHTRDRVQLHRDLQKLKPTYDHSAVLKDGWFSPF